MSDFIPVGVCPGSALLYHFFWNQLERYDDQGRHDDEVIQLANDRYEIGNDVEG